MSDEPLLLAVAASKMGEAAFLEGQVKEYRARIQQADDRLREVIDSPEFSAGGWPVDELLLVREILAGRHDDEAEDEDDEDGAS